MMNVDIALRTRPAFCIPKGPSFRWARKIHTTIVGTRIEFHAPKHRPRYRLKGKGTFPRASYTADHMHFESNFSPEFTIADSWEFKHLFKHDWAFNGPWFTGNLANLSMSLNIIRPKKSVAAARITGVSFFHPRAFEQAVGDYLTNRYSIHKTDGRAEWIAPVNWQPLTALPTMAVRLLVCRDEEVTYSRHHEFVFFAISDQQLGVITFWPSQRAMGTQAEQDAEVGRESMNDLMDNIIASLQIELSAEAAAAQSEALKGLDDTSLVKEFLPMKWTSAEEDALWESQNNKKCISN